MVHFRHCPGDKDLPWHRLFPPLESQCVHRSAGCHVWQALPVAFHFLPDGNSGKCENLQSTGKTTRIGTIMWWSLLSSFLVIPGISYDHPTMTIRSDPKVIQTFTIKAIGNPTAVIRNMVTAIFHFCGSSWNFIYPPVIITNDLLLHSQGTASRK